MTLRTRVRRLLPLSVKAFLRRAVSSVRRDSLPAARRKAHAYLASRGADPACVHLGCGTRVIDGWLNVDLLPHTSSIVGFNLRTGMPFLENESIDLIYHEHFFEHLDRRSARRLLADCRRVMKPGAWMRISMPDLDRMVRRYLSGWADDEGEFREYRHALYGDQLLDTPGEMLNLSMRGFEHEFVYGEKDIVRMLELNGFRNVRRMEHGVSSIEAFAGIETRSRLKEPLIVEAQK